MNKIERFGIVGSGDFGKVAADYLAPDNVEVLVFDQNPNATYPKSGQAASFKDVVRSDAVMLAVPYNPQFNELLENVSDIALDDSLLIWPGSVQILPVIDVQNSSFLSRQDREFFSCHPLFGPQWLAESGKLEGGKIVVTSSVGDKHQVFLEEWHNKGVEIFHKSVDEHDLEMAYIQGLSFFIGRTLIDMNLQPHEDLATGYFTQLYKLKTIEEQHSNDLFMTIERYNPYAKIVRAHFLTEAILRHARIGAMDIIKYPIDELAKYRETIDIIDQGIAYLMVLRFQATDAVGQLKSKAGIAFKDQDREEELVKNIEKLTDGFGLPAGLMAAIYKSNILPAVVARNSRNDLFKSKNQTFKNANS